MASTSFDPSNWAGRDSYDSNSAVIDNGNDNLIIDLGIHASADFWSNVASDGGDIRVTNEAGDTAYSFELENFDSTAETGILFFNSQGLSTSSDTTYRVYAGNSNAPLPADSDTLGAHNVWESDAEVISLQGGNDDSSANSNSGTENGNVTTGDTTANFGTGTSYDGTGDYVEWSNIDYQTIFGNTDFTISWWASFDNADDSNVEAAVAGEDSSNNGDADIWWETRVENNLVRYFFDDGTTNSNANSSSNTAPQSTFIRSDFVHDESSGYEMFVDGVSEATTADNGDISTTGQSMYFGTNARGGELEGKIGMVKIFSGTRSANWISTEYENQANNSNFWTNNGWTANDQPGRIGERNSNGIGLRTSAGIGKTD